MAALTFENGSVAKAVDEMVPFVPSVEEFMELVSRAERPLIVHFISDCNGLDDGGAFIKIKKPSGAGAGGEVHDVDEVYDETLVGGGLQREACAGPLGGELQYVELQTKVLGLELLDGEVVYNRHWHLGVYDNEADDNEADDNEADDDDDDDLAKEASNEHGYKERKLLTGITRAMGVAVSAVVENSEAQLKGLLRGDRIVQVNRTVVGRAVSHRHVARLIGQSSRPLRLVVERFPRMSALRPMMSTQQHQRRLPETYRGRLQARIRGTSHHNRQSNNNSAYGDWGHFDGGRNKRKAAPALQYLLEEAEIGHLDVPSVSISLSVTKFVGGQSTVPLFGTAHYWRVAVDNGLVHLPLGRNGVVNDDINEKRGASVTMAGYEEVNGADMGLVRMAARRDTGELIVEEVRGGSPAAQAGVCRGDEILAVNGVPWAHMSSSSSNICSSSNSKQQKVRMQRASVVGVRTAEMQRKKHGSSLAFAALSCLFFHHKGTCDRDKGNPIGDSDVVARCSVEAFVDVLRLSARPIFLTFRRGRGGFKDHENIGTGIKDTENSSIFQGH
jgi:hypothetical protein